MGGINRQMQKKIGWHISFVLFLGAVLAACSSVKQPDPQGNEALVSEYCGRYLFYQICTEDLNNDSLVDVSFFPDGREVMLYAPDVKEEDLKEANLTFHDCAQPMDEPLIEASTQLLRVPNQPKLLKKAKNDLFGHYLRYLPQVTACNARLAVGGDEPVQDSFGEEDF